MPVLHRDRRRLLGFYNIVQLSFANSLVDLNAHDLRFSRYIVTTVNHVPERDEISARMFLEHLIVDGVGRAFDANRQRRRAKRARVGVAEQIEQTLHRKECRLTCTVSGDDTKTLLLVR